MLSWIDVEGDPLQDRLTAVVREGDVFKLDLPFQAFDPYPLAQVLFWKNVENGRDTLQRGSGVL